MKSAWEWSWKQEWEEGGRLPKRGGRECMYVRVRVWGGWGWGVTLGSGERNHSRKKALRGRKWWEKDKLRRKESVWDPGNGG